MTGTPACVWGLAAELGEGPVWVARDTALWFVDIKGRRIHRLDPANGEHRSWDAPDQVGFVLPARGGGFVAGLPGRLARFDPADGSFAPLAAVDPRYPGNRLNDGTVAPDGRLWFGTMDDAETAPTGRLHRLDDDGTARPIPGCDCAITNGPAVSPDGKTLYHVDTLGKRIEAWEVTADGIADGRTFAAIEAGAGNPDGPSVDAEGYVWIGLYGGWGVRRYSPAGELVETVAFPVANVTKVAFGGPDLRTAYATTAWKGLSAGEREAQPLAGGLFAFAVDTPGLPGTEIGRGLPSS